MVADAVAAEIGFTAFASRGADLAEQNGLLARRGAANRAAASGLHRLPSDETVAASGLSNLGRHAVSALKPSARCRVQVTF